MINPVQGRRVYPLIVAHRGNSGEAPENTLAAFRRAVAVGADMIELDARFTRDGELVVFHDRTLHRIAGASTTISSLTYRELRSFDAGRWFDRKFAGETIPHLADVFQILPAAFPLNIEVKTDGDIGRRAQLASAVSILLRTSGATDRVFVSSFDHTFLDLLHKRDDAIPIGILLKPFARTQLQRRLWQERLGVSWVVGNLLQTRKHFVSKVRAGGFRFACFTVNTQRQFDLKVNAGVDAIITNHPRAMLSVRAAKFDQK